jgi:hypothetical protein
MMIHSSIQRPTPPWKFASIRPILHSKSCILLHRSDLDIR